MTPRPGGEGSFFLESPSGVSYKYDAIQFGLMSTPMNNNSPVRLSRMA